jgi:uncharacterized protein
MRQAAPAGLIVLPLALLAGSLALVATAAHAPAADGSGRVELELAGVLPMAEAPAGVLVLRVKGSDTILPLVVPDGRAFEARGARGGDGGLLGRAIEALGARVAEVEIERAEESSAGARVRLAQGGKDVELRAVPSESIALALAAGVPILARRRLVEEAGLTPEDLARAQAAQARVAPLRL